MSVVGFDIGNANCFIAIARAGGIETIDNEYSDRCTPSIVSFNSKQRLVGVSAKNQLITNLKSTIAQFKRLLGRKFDEPDVQEELQYQNSRIIRMDDGGIGIEVTYKNELRIFTPLQVMSMLLSELKNTAFNHIKKPITDCVISVPSFYTDYQRRTFLQAAHIAGLNCLKLMNETSAISLNYGLFKQDLPPPDQKPRHVAFVDMGHSSLQISIAAFNKGKIKILSSASDPNLGGRNFDMKLKHHFADVFLDKYKLDVRKNTRAWTRLGTEVEKLKKQMSSNSTKLPLNIECLMDDKDVSHSIDRAEFEEMCKDLIVRFGKPFEEALADSGLSPSEIDVVELVGGSTRIPSLKQCVENIFQKPPSMTLNLDEAVARGCAIQCAMLSHTVKVRDIEVMDAASYPISISWDSVKPGEPNGEMEVFKKHHSYPFTKLLTFPHRVEPFCFQAFYKPETAIPHYERQIGKFIVNAGAPTESDDLTKVKVKVRVRLDIHGCFTVSSASMVEALPQPPESEKEEPMDTTPAADSSETNAQVNEDKKSEDQEKQNEAPKEPNAEGSTESPDNTKTAESASEKKVEDVKKPEAKKSKKSTKTTELTVTSHQAGPTPEKLLSFLEVENELISEFRMEKARADAKNSVEEYIYYIREKLYNECEKYVTEDARAEFSTLLTNTEDWLYEDGEDEKKQVYVEKLAELKKYGDPIQSRYQAYKDLPAAFEAFGASITHFRKILDLFAKKDEKYAHIEQDEMKKVHNKVEEKFKWFNEKMQSNAKSLPTSTPVVYPSQILTEKKLLDDFCNPIVNKPKPKVEPPKEDKKDEGETANKNNEKDTSNEKMDTDDKANEQEKPKSNLDMEVD